MHYDTLASEAVLEKVKVGLAERNFEFLVVENRREALEKIKELIPQGASVMNGASVTLEEIGMIDYLKSDSHGWNNLHTPIVAEKDPAKQKILRGTALNSEYYLGSVHALTESGEMIIASNTGSQLPHLAFSSPNLVLVAGTQKIVSDLSEGFDRLEKYIMPLEDQHMKNMYGFGTMHNKTLILHGENPMLGRKITVILVKEKLGF